MANHWQGLVVAAAAALGSWLLPGGALAGYAANPDDALRISREAVGRQVGDYVFTNTDGRAVRLSDFRGRPLVISLIYTACADICPQTTDTLADAAEEAWGLLGPDSFRVVTIGFDTTRDTPNAMRLFAGRRGLKHRNWLFLSGDLQQVAGLSDDTGFSFYPSPKGFDHLSQTTILDAEGRVAAQIYGDVFQNSELVAPLRDLAAGRPIESVADLVERVRVFCTVYDPKTGRYVFDYSFFIEIFAGITVLSPVAWFLIRNRRSRHRPGT